MSRAPEHRGERGIALLLAVIVLAALGVISVTGLTLARAERAAGLAALARVQARGAAEAALAEALLGWPSSSTPVGAGSVVRLTQLAVPGPAQGQASIRALGGPVYALQATGVRHSAAGQLLGLVALERLVLLSEPDSNSFIHPRLYPRGWRLLP